MAQAGEQKEEQNRPANLGPALKGFETRIRNSRRRPPCALRALSRVQYTRHEVFNLTRIKEG